MLSVSRFVSTTGSKKANGSCPLFSESQPRTLKLYLVESVEEFLQVFHKVDDLLDSLRVPFALLRYVESVQSSFSRVQKSNTRPAAATGLSFWIGGAMSTFITRSFHNPRSLIACPLSLKMESMPLTVPRHPYAVSKLYSTPNTARSSIFTIPCSSTSMPYYGHLNVRLNCWRRVLLRAWSCVICE